MRTKIRHIAQATIVVFMLSSPLFIFADGPGGPGSGNGSGAPGANNFLGEGAPLDGGLGIVLALSAAYGFMKTYRKKKFRENT